MKESAEVIRKDFPYFDSTDKLVFLDTAASAQKPSCVLNSMYDIYSNHYANIHRGSYELSDKLTARFEDSRKLIGEFINAGSSNEIVFTRSATEAINLVAYAYGNEFIGKGDEIVISNLEHHSNIVPWQQLCKRVGAELRVCNFEDIQVTNKTSLVAVTHMSNVFGCITPIKEIIERAHKVGAKVLVDACQSIVHFPIDVLDMDCDFLVFSSHKLYGPCGVGVLYVKYSISNAMIPFQSGGAMVRKVTYIDSTFQDPPLKFEAGTQPIVEVIGLAETIKYLKQINRAKLLEHENTLRAYLLENIHSLGGWKILGTEYEGFGLLSFIHPSIENSDIGMLLNKIGIAIRVGHHCAQPLLESLGFKSTVRASLGIYNTLEDIDYLIKGLYKIQKIMGIYG